MSVEVPGASGASLPRASVRDADEVEEVEVASGVSHQDPALTLVQWDEVLPRPLDDGSSGAVSIA